MNSAEKAENLKSFSQIAQVIEKDSSMILKNPVLGDVVFANGTFGNLEKKNTGGFGIKHIIEGRYRKDKMTKEDISALLFLIKYVVETVSPADTSKAKINLVKSGIWVGITRNWADTDEKWIVTGYGEIGKDGQMIKEATDAIKAVNAQYGYAPEFLSVGRQVGAVIASVDKITHSPEKSTAKGHPTGEKLEKSVYERTTVVVDGKRVVCEKGLLQGFKDEYRKLERSEQKVRELSEEIENLRRNQSQTFVRNHDDGFDY